MATGHVTLILALLLVSAKQSLEYSSPLTYCSKPGEAFTKARKIPDLPGTDGTLQLRLKQVITLNRHGSRTPTNQASNTCWPAQREDGNPWYCVYGESFSGELQKSEAGSYAIIQADEASSGSDDRPDMYGEDNFQSLTFNFNKVYDARPEYNVMNGTCGAGHLIADAIPQTKTLSDSIYEGYFTGPHKLFNASDLIENGDLLYFRSTDMQRTRNTGALIVSDVLTKLASEENITAPGKFDHATKVHMNDLSRDSFAPARAFCPHAKQISANALKSKEGRAMQSSHIHLYATAKDATRMSFSSLYNSDMLDCFMCALCTRSQLLPPEFVVNENSTEDSLGYRLWHAIEEEQSFIALWNNSQYSRCVASNAFQDILSAINSAETAAVAERSVASNAKWVLLSAHDTTILYLTSSMPEIVDRSWPSFASLFTFENYYSETNGKSYFRITFNGVDLTSKFLGCNETSSFKEEGVCETSIFVSYVMKWMEPTNPMDPTDSGDVKRPERNILYLVVGIAAGAIVMLLVSQLTPLCRRNKKSGYSQV